jgi:hypothetical protein
MNNIRTIVCSAAMLVLTAPVMGAVIDTGQNSSSGIIAVNSLPNPPATVATAGVADAKGTMVGTVRQVVMDTSGKPVTVDVALLGSNAVVAMDASKFNYDQGHNVLTAELDARQIAQQPSVPPS